MGKVTAKDIKEALACSFAGKPVYFITECQPTPFVNNKNAKYSLVCLREG